MPGGGRFVTASLAAGQADLNNKGAVVFNALLKNGDEGLYVFSHGSLSLVAKTGTVIPGAGKIAALDFFNSGQPTSFARINDRGKVAFGVTLTDGRGALLLATPGGTGNGAVAAVNSALAMPTAGATMSDTDLSEISASLVLVGQSTSDHSGTNATSPLANPEGRRKGWLFETSLMLMSSPSPRASDSTPAGG